MMFEALLRFLNPNKKNIPSILYPSGSSADKHLSRNYYIDLKPPHFLSIAIDCAIVGSIRVANNKKTMNSNNNFMDKYPVLIEGGAKLGPFAEEPAQNIIESLFHEQFTEISISQDKLKVVAEPITRSVSYPYVRSVVEKLIRLDKMLHPKSPV